MYKLLPILLFAYGLALTTEDIYDNSYALIIGINKYKNVSNLDYAVKDAKSIASLLTDNFNFPSENIKVLLNDEATYSSVRFSLAEISKTAKANDRVLIYFAGHGVTEDLPDGGEMGYLLPVDGDADNLYITSIGMDELKKISSMSQSKHMLFLIDACYGGLAATGARGLSSTSPNFIKKITNDKSRQIITAGGRGEQVIEKAEWGHSAFTMNLIRALKNGKADYNDDGYITADELGLFLKEKVTIDSDNMQTPQSRRFTSQEGEFIFISNADKVILQNNEKVIFKEAPIDYDMLAEKIAKKLQNDIPIETEKEFTKPSKDLIHFTSLPEYKAIYGNGLNAIDNYLLDSLREYFDVQLLNWFFGQNKNFIIPDEQKKIKYLNQNPLLSIHHGSTIKGDFSYWFNNGKLLYEEFNEPTSILYINIYQISSSEENTEYNISFSGLRDKVSNNFSGDLTVDTETELFNMVGKYLRNHFGEHGNIGKISKINDDIVFVKLSDINVRKNMELVGRSTYYFGPGNEGYINTLEDYKNAIEYMTKIDNEYNELHLDNYQNFYSYLLADSLYCINGCVQTRAEEYKLKVVEVMDSVAVTKIISRNNPWVKIRINDYVSIVTN